MRSVGQGPSRPESLSLFDSSSERAPHARVSTPAFLQLRGARGEIYRQVYHLVLILVLVALASLQHCFAAKLLFSVR